MTIPNKTHFHRLVRDMRMVVQDAKVDADLLLGSALANWCSTYFPGLPSSALPTLDSLQNAPAVCAFVEFVSSLDFIESTYWFSSAYAQLLGDERRKHQAMFFTPPSLTRRMLDDLSTHGVDFATRSFCDPACGGAAFLAPIAMRMRDLLRQQGVSAAQTVSHIQERILGFEQDAALCELSKHFLLMALHKEVITAGFSPKFRVYQGDSLLQTTHLWGKLDVVVCNPPFRKMRSIEVDQYFNEFETVIQGQPNLYALFISLCIRLLAPGGICALVTPTSFLSGQNFSKLRSYMMAQTKLLGIGMVGDRLGVFMDVQQETALTFARRENNGHGPSTEAKVSLVSKDGSYIDVGQCILPNMGAAWPIPRLESDIPLLKSAAKSQAGLVDYGYVPRIGAFVWNRDTRTTYTSAKAAAAAHDDVIVPLLWSSDISPNGVLRFNGTPKNNKECCFVNMGEKDHRSIISRPSVLLQRVTSNEQPRRLVAAVVPTKFIDVYGGFVGENHTVILEQIAPEPALTPTQLVQLLGTPTVDRYFRCISGATNVSIFELSQLRLPDPKRLRGFLEQGVDMVSAAQKAMEMQ
ncbi:HsdM family class I SAM-dependent methyltransferase [Aeromonas hydrophila]